jgi:hypothetical protein
MILFETKFSHFSFVYVKEIHLVDLKEKAR